MVSTWARASSVPFQADALERFQEHVGGRGKQKPELIGPPGMTTGPITKETQLLFFNAVFHLTASTINVVVKALGTAFQIGQQITAGTGH
jgi:hypothetical protein